MRRSAIKQFKKRPLYKPKSERHTLKYVEQYMWTATELKKDLDTFCYRANDVYCPRVSLGGHSACGYAELAQKFNHYAVVKSWITFKTWPEPFAQGFRWPLAIGIMKSDSVTPATTSYLTVCEQNVGVHMRPCSWYGDMLPQGNLSMSFNVHTDLGTENIGDDIPRVGAKIGEHPLESTFFHLWICNMTGAVSGTSLKGFYCEVTMHFDVIFYEQDVQLRTLDMVENTEDPSHKGPDEEGHPAVEIVHFDYNYPAPQHISPAGFTPEVVDLTKSSFAEELPRKKKPKCELPQHMETMEDRMKTESLTPEDTKA